MQIYKWLVPGFAVVVVLARDEEQARDLARDHMHHMGLDFDKISSFAKLQTLSLDIPCVLCAAQV